MQIMTGTLNIENLEGKLAVSNTPAYLYKHYRADKSVYELSKNNTPELIDALRKIFKDVESTEHLAKIYAIVIALTFKPYNEVKDFFEAFKDSGLMWAGKIAEIFFLNNSIENIQYTFNISDNPHLIQEKDQPKTTMQIL
jgi:hypothetical protein